MSIIYDHTKVNLLFDAINWIDIGMCQEKLDDYLIVNNLSQPKV